VMGESLSPDRVFDFPEDEPELHPAYDFFAPRPLPGYAAVANEPMAVPAIEEVAEPEEEQVVAPVVDMEEEQMAALVMDMEEDLAALFGEDVDFKDDDFSDDDSEGVREEEPPSIYEVGGPSTVAAEGPSFPLPTPGLPIPPSVIKDLSTRLGNLEYEHGQLVKKVIHVSDVEMVHAADRWENVGAQVEQGQLTATHGDETIVEMTQ
nr:hypothetical protein [Tanacetum cinerariifolium]